MQKGPIGIFVSTLSGRRKYLDDGQKVCNLMYLNPWAGFDVSSVFQMLRPYTAFASGQFTYDSV